MEKYVVKISLLTEEGRLLLTDTVSNKDIESLKKSKPGESALDNALATMIEKVMEGKEVK